MYQKKRIELIIERMAYKRACRLLEANGVTGYTVLPAMAGFGNGNHWTRDTDISTSRDMVIVICVTDAENAKGCLEQIGNLLGDHVGIVTVGDVEVLRPGRF